MACNGYYCSDYMKVIEQGGDNPFPLIDFYGRGNIWLYLCEHTTGGGRYWVVFGLVSSTVQVCVCSNVNQL